MIESDAGCPEPLQFSLRQNCNSSRPFQALRDGPDAFSLYIFVRSAQTWLIVTPNPFFPENRLTIPEKFPNIYIDIKQAEKRNSTLIFPFPERGPKVEGPYGKQPNRPRSLCAEAGERPGGTARTRR